MEEHKSLALLYEVASMKQQLTQQFPISEPTVRQMFLRILTLLENVLEDVDGETIPALDHTERNEFS